MSFTSEAFAQPETARIAVLPGRRAWPTQTRVKHGEVIESSALGVGIITTSLALHFLLVGFLGSGVTQETVRVRRPVAPPPTRVVEEVKLEPAPVEPPAPTPVAPVIDAIATPANIDIPSLPPLQPIAAVAESVHVAFALAVKGPVRLVANAAAADGAVGGARRSEPVSVDANRSVGRNLLLPPLLYPADASRLGISGQVEVEFHTSPTGDIYDVRIRRSSGSPLLDRAALQNLRAGRWVGEAGYFVKAYTFVRPS